MIGWVIVSLIALAFLFIFELSSSRRSRIISLTAYGTSLRTLSIVIRMLLLIFSPRLLAKGRTFVCGSLRFPGRSRVYNQIAKGGLNVRWGSWIWTRFLPVRRSIISWRAIRGRLPTQDYFMRYGFSGPNIYLLCHRAAESIDHIFWTCPIAAEAWNRFLGWFEMGELPPIFDLNSFIVFAMAVKHSPQFSNVWKLGVVTLIWKLWKERNDCVFEGRTASSMQVIGFVKAAIIEASRIFDLGCCWNDEMDQLRGRRMGITCAVAAPLSYLSVTWWPPLPQWIKVNTDGSAADCPGKIAAGGVFRDAAGFVRCCFHVDGDVGFACEAELLAAITAVLIAFHHGWTKLWLETDSTYVERLFKTKAVAVPWRFINSWRHTLRLVEDMDFRISHIYREGNQVADALANPAIPAGWWPYCIPQIADAVARDWYSPRFHRKA